MQSDDSGIPVANPVIEGPPVRGVDDLRFVNEAEMLECGLPVFTDVWPIIEDYGPYTAINALRLAIDKRMADESFTDPTIRFKFWTAPPLGSLKRKNRRVAMKAELYQTKEGTPWVLLTTSRSESSR